MERTYKTRGVILSRKTWRESDLLFSIYTERFGRINAVAIGAKKIRSKLAGHLPAFGLAEIVFVRGRAHKKIIQACLLQKREIKTEQDYYGAAAVMEVIEKSLPEEERYETVWPLLEWTTTKILKKETADEKKMILNLFLIKLISALGYRIPINSKINLSATAKELLEQIQSENTPPAINASKETCRQLFDFLREYLFSTLERPFLSLSALP